MTEEEGRQSPRALPTARAQPTGRGLRNVLALIGDFVFFSVGFAFYDPLVVVPAFVSEFTGSELLVGLLSALRVLFITVPQIWAASVLEAQPRMKPLLIWSSIGGRLPILLLAGAVMWLADEHLGWVIATLALSVIFFYTSEGLNGVSWPALVGKVVPERFRGRFFGIGQLISSLGSAGAGYLVNQILADEGLPLSTRWALLFALAYAGLLLSVGSMTFIREAPEDREPGKVDVRRSLGKMWAYLRHDRWLRRMILTQLIVFTASAVFGFFVVRARQIVPEGRSMVGTFVVLQSVGSAAAALVGGTLVDRVGSWAAIRGAAFAELLALVAATLAGLSGISLPLYLTAFFLMGYVNGTSWWSFTAYLLDVAPEARRPIYLATSGVLVSVTALNPVIVGALFELLLPEVLFAGAGVLALLGLVVAWTLRGGRRFTCP
ncbi:MAG: MFS transporter [Anaerolineae bacterium]